VFVEAVEQGPAGVTDQPAQYSIAGLEGDDAQNFYGLAQSMTLAKQDFQGIDDAFEFDPFTEEYVRVADMEHARWYPTLTGLADGRVLAVSGLDETGTILTGQNEVYDPEEKTWTERHDLFRYFPTYPALFQTSVPDRLFYSGSTAGYGPEDQGRVPGFWDLEDNTFLEVPGLRDADLMETSASTWVGPVQDQRMIVVGGGGVGESPRSTTRIDVIDLDEPKPRFVPGPDFPHPVRYPNTVQLPDDTVLISNGSRDYRGKGDSDVLAASLYHPDTNSLTPAAAPTIGRNYHSAALLLPNGQVLTLGGGLPVQGPRQHQRRGIREAAGDLHPTLPAARPAAAGDRRGSGSGGARRDDAGEHARRRPDRGRAVDPAGGGHPRHRRRAAVCRPGHHAGGRRTRARCARGGDDRPSRLLHALPR
jgi:hypothetical protein